MQLYDDQQQVLAALRLAYREGARAPLLVAPTGFGKTVVFSSICKGAHQRGHRVWILVHRQELIDQVARTLTQFGVEHGIISPHYAPLPDRAVQVASVRTLVRRMAQVTPPDLIVIDEAHHAIPGSTWGQILAGAPRARLLGVTATPARHSGEGLGDTFDRLVIGPDVAQLIAAGRLSPVKVFAPPTIDVAGVHTALGDFKKDELLSRVDKPRVTGDAIEHYQRLTPHQRAVVFCVSLEHARHLAQAARAAGIRAVEVDGQMERALRREVIRDFEAGKIDWLVSVDLISEGFDCPGIEVGISLRPTQSLGLWIQQCGRCIRTAPGKSHATILDHAGNTLRHGLPTAEREWFLSVAPRSRDARAAAPSIRVCPKCWSANRSSRATCAHCGFIFAIEPRTVGKAQGELKEITQSEIDARRAKAQERAKVGMSATLESLTELGRIRNYKDPAAWARYVMAGREKKKAKQR